MKNISEIDQFKILKRSEITLIKKQLKKQKYDEGDVIIPHGKVTEKVIFIQKGIAAGFYYRGKKQFIRDFYFEGSFFRNYYNASSFTKFSVNAITPCLVQSISRSRLLDMIRQIPELKKIQEDLDYIGFINISNRLEMMLTKKPEERYLELLREKSFLFNQIPLYLIASYLGITDVALSRIRRRISTFT
jgi:signal-transduction protein with cAMP-binding, CBS, and nucleotidyltransferase domain